MKNEQLRMKKTPKDMEKCQIAAFIIDNNIE